MSDQKDQVDNQLQEDNDRRGFIDDESLLKESLDKQEDEYQLNIDFK